MSAIVVERWHEVVKTRDTARLKRLLAEDVVFHSPVVHSPQKGRAMTMAYLTAALSVLGQPSFRYVREIVAERDALLEFMVELDGIVLNGVDIIRWNDQNLITDLKVMIRPLKAINLVHQKMQDMLQTGE